MCFGGQSMDGMVLKINQILEEYPLASILVNCKRLERAVKLEFVGGEFCYLLVGCMHNGKDFFVDEYIRHGVINDNSRRFITRGRNTASTFWARKLKGENTKKWSLRSSILVSR